MSRFFINSQTSPVIEGEEYKHLASVLRLKAGDTVTLCDGAGMECEAQITALTGKQALLTPGEWVASLSEPVHKVTLFQCLPKTGKMEVILQKCTELGLSTLVPVVSHRCVALPGKEYEKKRQRYEKVAEAAAKQSRRGRIPTVTLPVDIGKLDVSAYDVVLVAYEGEHALSLKQALAADPGENIALLIGPEGGFEEEEVRSLVEKGAVSVSLGTRILRTETAGMAMLSQLLFALEG